MKTFLLSWSLLLSIFAISKAQTANTYFGQGKKLYKIKKYPEAIVRLNEAIALDSLQAKG